MELRSILVIEDDQSEREGLTILLATEGFRVRCATNGQEALTVLESGDRPSLMLLDLMLPEVTGKELLKYTHEDPELRSIPVIVITGNPDRVGHVVADHVLVKPLDVPYLLDLVRKLLPSSEEG